MFTPLFAPLSRAPPSGWRSTPRRSLERCLYRFISERPALETVKSIQLYVRSLERYGKSPYIYPMYGLGGLPEGFSRLCAIHGGTFMLQCPVEEILFDDQGVAWGIKATMDGVPQARIVFGI